MKNKIMGMAIVIAFSAAAHAGMINSHSFNGVTTSNISTTGTLDWGFISGAPGLFNPGPYNDADFGTGVVNNKGDSLTTVNGSPEIGNVTLTEGTSGQNTTGNFSLDTASGFTFDGVDAEGGYQLDGGDDDVWTLRFNDLGVGTFEISVYLGHEQTDQSFTMDYSLSDGAATNSGTTTMGTLAGLGSTVSADNGGLGRSFSYNIDVTTTTSTADLELTFGSASGTNGFGVLAGYTVVPEPATMSLVASFGLALLVLRRRFRS
ncbi:MAG TPA: PEP-CTERM sorting domain-containing protein [Tichowtungia sp.]|nr:PEP-CTERM sorting domain-containing protein [Tichowtungia sp.]